VFRTIGDPPSPWELRLPAELLRLPAELARVDALLDDPAFFAPFAPHFHPVLGRPSTPIECYLRLMFLKYRYRLGYESLCAEVSDSISWRRFCRIPLDATVPHPTTLMKLTTRCGEGAVTGLNEALWAKAVQARLLRTARVRADTTVIAANVAYPTDAGLLAKAVGKLVRAARRVRAAGGATGTVMTDRRRAAARRMRELAAHLRARAKLGREESTRAIARVTSELAGLAETAATQAAAVARNGRRALPRALSGPVRGRLRRALDELVVAIGRTATIVAQTRSRLAGHLPDSATRLVSLTTPMPGRSARAASTARSSSGTRPRSSTTTTASSWITPSKPATRQTLPSSRPRSPGSRDAAAACRARSPLTAATATPRPTGTWENSESARSPSRAGPRSHPPAAPSSTPAHSAPWSNGEPAVKAGSVISSADTAGTAPAWTPWSLVTTRSAWKPTCTTSLPTGGSTWSTCAASSSAPDPLKSATSSPA
jgi:IS5 family transposase